MISQLTIFIAITILLNTQNTNDNNSKLPTAPPSALKLFDSNNDKRISYNEASEILQEHFCEYDIDQSGYLADEEIKEISPKYIKP